MTLSCYDMFCVNFAKALCSEACEMQISEAGSGGGPRIGTEPCRFPKLEECAHFHYERVQLPQLVLALQTNMDQSLHSQHTNEEDESEWFMVQVTSGDECWLIQRNFENFQMLDDQLHQCIFDRKISQLSDLSSQSPNDEELESKLMMYLERLSNITDNSVNCGPVLNWLQMDNKGHRLLVPNEESRSINTPAVAAAYSVRRYVSQARDELNLEVGDMISVIDMASPGESMWWRGKRGFQVGFFPQHCVHIIGDKVPRNMPLPPPVVGPSRRRLKQSGILKERVFGCDLGEHLLNSGHDVPMVLRCCAEFIEKNGIVDGIYRLSGITSNIQKLRNAFDEDRIPNLYTEDILQDIHSVASLLKMYFRELPNPLCTYQLYQSFVNAVQGCGTAVRNTETDHERLLKMRESVQKLPPPHYRTLEYLMRHLACVAKHGASTGMTTRNVAIVWAPNLLRCEALEVGGVAALQGVGVQAVVTEFLICYADLIFCDHLPNLDHPELVEKENFLMKKCRPNSLAISTPTKLITLEEARSKHLLNNKSEECNNYIEVGGGPKNLPKKYHTVIELPSGARKRGHTKRSPLGWRLFFSRSRNNSQGSLTKNRKASTPIIINASKEKSVTESDLTDMKRKLRSVKSAESLTSGHSEPASCEDILGPLHSLNKPPGHNRSVSHDSYFDTLQSSQNNSEGSLLDLSEIRLNFDLEESEMRIFSEDESLVCSPRSQKDTQSQRRVLTRARPDDFGSTTNSVNPSPKKQARVVLSPDSMSRKRTRLEDQLSDIQFIDCNTPENVVSTTALVHTLPESPIAQAQKKGSSELYQPKNKSPRNSNVLDKRQSLNLEGINNTKSPTIPKSFTELDINRKYLGGVSITTTPTPGSPGYKQLGDSSANTSPGFSPSPTEVEYRNLSKKSSSKPGSPNYENILTTISITYKSPPRSLPTTPVYENVIFNPEKVVIPTSTASLPIQEATQPTEFLTVEKNETSERPKSLSALEDFNSQESTVKANSSGAVCNTSDQLSLGSLNDQRTLSSRSSGSNVQYTASVNSTPYHFIENSDHLSPTDLSLSEVVQSSTENLSTSHTSLSFASKNSLSPNVSPTMSELKNSTENLLSESDAWLAPNRPTSVNLIDFSPVEEPSDGTPTQNEKRKSEETESQDDNAIYQQVKYFRRSIHEVNALLDLENNIAQAPNESTNDYEAVDVKSEILNVENEEIDVKNECVDAKDECEKNCDSLEAVYENIEGNSMRNDDKTETTEKIVEEERGEEKISVKSLTNKFETKSDGVSSKSVEDKLAVLSVEDSDKSTQESTNSARLRKFYEKDSLPPCLRARNLKHQLKTRSLDEEQFNKEFKIEENERRKSLDESNTYKTNSLPKTLNPPKTLPEEGDNINLLHMSHSTENINTVTTEEEEQKKRERIEKYKEERRRILHEKYRSESFKEDKDVILSRLKIYKSRDENIDLKPSSGEYERPLRGRRRSTQSECESSNASDSLEDDVSSSKQPIRDKFPIENTKTKETKPMTESLKSRAAIFEKQNQKTSLPPLDIGSRTRVSLRDKTKEIEKKNTQTNKERCFGKVEKNTGDDDDLKDLDFIRTKRKEDDKSREERRRHTYESRERETEADRLRRISVDSKSPRKEKVSPTYCIKDMKAIFESKSKQ